MKIENQSDIPASSPRSSSNSTWILVVVLVALILGGIGGYFLGLKNASNLRNDQTNYNQSPSSPPERSFSSPLSSSLLASTSPGTTEKAKLVSTAGWKTETIGGLTVKLPPEATISDGFCENSYENCYLIKGHDPNLLSPPHITLKVKAYEGGSRREEANLDLPLTDYSFTEKVFGSTTGLEATNVCQIKECTSLRNVILVVSDKLILVTDGIYKNGSSTTLESTVTNSIIASIGS